MNESKFMSRKFLLASFFGVTGCVMFAFTSKLTGGDFITLSGLVLGAFTAGDAAEKFINRGKP